MKKKLKIAGVTAAIALILIPDSADAVLGVRRRVARRTTVVVAGTVAATSAASANSQAAAANSQTTAAQQQSAAAQQQAAAAKKEAAAAEKKAAAAEKKAAAAEKEAAAAKKETAVAQGKLPLGAIVSALPANCTTTVAGEVQYFQCGVNYYRAVFQGNTLVYVTAQP